MRALWLVVTLIAGLATAAARPWLRPGDEDPYDLDRCMGPASKDCIPREPRKIVPGKKLAFQKVRSPMGRKAWRDIDFKTETLLVVGKPRSFEPATPLSAIETAGVLRVQVPEYHFERCGGGGIEIVRARGVFRVPRTAGRIVVETLVVRVEPRCGG